MRIRFKIGLEDVIEKNHIGIILTEMCEKELQQS